MPKTEHHQPADADQDHELLKAVAQAWHAQTSNPKPTNELDAQKNRFGFKPRPTRFKMEAMVMASKDQYSSWPSASTSHWDFADSLLDSYEIVTLSKKLEVNMALDPMSGPVLTGKRRAKSRNSLRNLFYKMSSKRFDLDAGGFARGEGD